MDSIHARAILRAWAHNDPRKVQAVLGILSMGYTPAQMALVFNVDATTIRRWVRDFRAVVDSIAEHEKLDLRSVQHATVSE